MLIVRLILPAMLLVSCFSNEKENVHSCSNVWEGSYLMNKDGKLFMKVERKGKYQIEYPVQGEVLRYKVDWLDSCRYRLRPISRKPVASKMDILPVMVQITEVRPDGSYSFEGWIEGKPYFSIKDELIRVVK